MVHVPRNPCARLAGMSIAIRPCRVADIQQAPNIDALVSTYAEESLNQAIGPANPQWDTYRHLEEIGLMRVVGAFDGDTLVGFVFVLVSVLPHFGKPVASSESVFVRPESRKHGTGTRLLRAAETMAKEMGADGFLVSAPTGSRLERIMPHQGYRETNRVFYRDLP